MKYHHVIVFLLCTLTLLAQQKGASPIVGARSLTGTEQPTNTYAVVVGISDYEDEDIAGDVTKDRFLKCASGGRRALEISDISEVL